MNVRIIDGRRRPIFPGDPREKSILVQKPGPVWGMEPIAQHRFRMQMDIIAPKVCKTAKPKETPHDSRTGKAG